MIYSCKTTGAIKSVVNMEKQAVEIKDILKKKFNFTSLVKNEACKHTVKDKIRMSLIELFQVCAFDNSGL